MSNVTVKVPTGTRPVVARHTLQVALPRSVPAVTEEADRTSHTYPAQPKTNRLAPAATTSTNEFGTSRTPRTSRSPVISREPAGTKIVDFGETVDLQPRGRFNVRGVGADGFFPPVKLRTGAHGVRFSKSPGSARSCKSAGQIPASPTTSSLNVELAPAKSSRTSTSNETDSSGEWLPSARSENKARTHILQDRPPNPYNTRAVVAAAREPFSLNKETSSSSSQTAFASNPNHTTPRTGSQDNGRPNKDAAWVRSFKVRQKRHNRVREILDSRPVGLIVTSPVYLDTFR